MGLLDGIGGFLTGSNRSAYGWMDVPGTTAIDLPAGEVSVYYCETGQRGDLERRFSPPPDLEVGIGPEGGQPVTIVPARLPFSGEQPTQDGVYQFVKLGEVVVTSPGRWVVTATGGDGNRPHLRFGT